MKKNEKIPTECDEVRFVKKSSPSSVVAYVGEKRQLCSRAQMEAARLFSGLEMMIILAVVARVGGVVCPAAQTIARAKKL